MANIPHDLGFISCPNAPCGLSSCNRSNPHYHCRLCGFGTSQMGNAMAHSRLCPSLDISQKDFNIPSVTEAMYPVSSQSFPYYPQSSSTSSTSSKLMSSQQSAMFNFVLPTQNSQYSGLFGPQSVYPNPNLFSPSNFNSLTQMDSSWMAQSRIISALNCSPELEKNSKSPSCCKIENSGLSSSTPVPLEPCKVTHKEMQPQNWYSPQLYPSNNQAKYCESLSSSSCSLSLVLLEQNKDTDECVNVDDICFTPDSKQNGSPCSIDSAASEESDIVVEDSDSDLSDITTNICLVCKTKPCSTILKEKLPVTLTSQSSVSKKIFSILQYEEKNCSICNRCLELINLIDSLEVKLSVAIDEIKVLFKSSKETVEINIDNDIICNICNKTFSSAAYLAKHKQYHTKSFSFYCEYCGKGFTDLRKLEQHVLLHSSSRRFQCELCGKQFLEKYTLTNHIRQHKGEHRFYCSVCKKGFVQKSVFKIHVESHNDSYFVCQHCGRKVKTYANLQTHVKICSGNLKFNCDKCEKGFPLKSLLQNHINIQHKLKFRFSCEFCNKGFWKESDLNSHLKTHSNDKPFNCKSCGNSYKNKKDLTHHMRLHEDNKFKCKICLKNFTRSDALSDHMNGHNGIKPYECSICFKKFANRINFNVHFKRHDSNRTGNKCLVCQKVILGKLTDHMKTHNDKKSFMCKFCSSSFAFKNSLVKHLKAKHQSFNKALS